MKGPHSEETKRKISEARKGKGHPHTEESIRKIKEAQKGKPRQGHPHTEEHKAHMREVMKGKNVGKVRSKETRQRLSQAGKGKKLVLSEEERKRRSERLKGRIVSEEQRQKISEANRGRKPSEEEKQRRQEGMAPIVNTPEYRAKLSAGVRKAFENPEVRERRVRAWAAANRIKGRTDIEIIVAQVLDALEVEYEQQKRMGHYLVDFYIPSKKLVIECDGTYWHNKPDVKERDARKDAYLLSQGYIVLRFTDVEIKKNKLDTLIDLF